MSRKFVFTGQLNVGKDYVAAAADLTPITLPEPIYRAVKYFAGSDDKTNPVIRKALQTLGMWGRGKEGEPLETIAGYGRFEVIEALQSRGMEITGMDLRWHDCGRNPEFWANEALLRMKKVSENGANCVMPNARFESEVKLFSTEVGASHYHIMCDENERRRRMNRPFDPTIDLSETEIYAYKLSKKVMEEGADSIVAAGVIWNDPTQAPPDKRMITVDTFVARVGKPTQGEELQGNHLRTRQMAVPLMTRETNSSSSLPL